MRTVAGLTGARARTKSALAIIDLHSLLLAGASAERGAAQRKSEGEMRWVLYVRVSFDEPEKSQAHFRLDW